MYLIIRWFSERLVLAQLDAEEVAVRVAKAGVLFPSLWGLVVDSDKTKWICWFGLRICRWRSHSVKRYIYRNNIWCDATFSINSAGVKRKDFERIQLWVCLWWQNTIYKYLNCQSFKEWCSCRWMGTMRMITLTPTMEVVLSIPPLNIFIEQTAMSTVYRLYCTKK